MTLKWFNRKQEQPKPNLFTLIDRTTVSKPEQISTKLTQAELRQKINEELKHGDFKEAIDHLKKENIITSAQEKGTIMYFPEDDIVEWDDAESRSLGRHQRNK